MVTEDRKYLVKFDDNQNDIYMEVIEPESVQSTIPASRSINDTIISKLSFEQAIARIKPSTQKLVSQLRELRADEVEVEFGLKVSAELGVIITSGGVEANYVVKLKWNNRSEVKNE